MGTGVHGAAVDGEVERFGDIDREPRGDLGVLDDHDLAGGIHQSNVLAIGVDGDAGRWRVHRGCGRGEARIGVFDHGAHRSGRQIFDRDRFAIDDRLIAKNEW